MSDGKFIPDPDFHKMDNLTQNLESEPVVGENEPVENSDVAVVSGAESVETTGTQNPESAPSVDTVEAEAEAEAEAKAEAEAEAVEEAEGHQNVNENRASNEVKDTEKFDPSTYVEPPLEDNAIESIFVARTNTFKKGTIEWIREEHSIVTEHLSHVQEDFDKFTRILKLDNALVHSGKVMLEDRTHELTDLLEAQESLSSWIGERQSTYAWQLLDALHAQRQKIIDFEADVKTWCERPVKDLYETSLKHQKRFKRKLKFGLGGIILALTIGIITNLILNFFHIHWIFRILAFIATLLGIGNPLASVPVILGGLSIVTWITALTSHFRSYIKFRRQLEQQVAEARFNLRAVKEIGRQKAKVAALHAQVQDYLVFMAEVLHKPWVIDEKWLNYETTTIDPTKLPASLVVAKPLETGIYREVTKKVIEEFAATNWRTRQFEILMAEAEKRYLMGANTLEARVNSDAAIREKIKTDIESTELLDLVGTAVVGELAKRLRDTFLPNELGFHVGSIKPDTLGSLNLSSNIFGESNEEANWHTFVTSILGQASGWSNLAFSVSGLESRLSGSDSMKSFALIPDRLRQDVLSPVEAVPLKKDDNSGIEVVVRVDVTSWLDPEKVNLLNPEPSTLFVPVQAISDTHRPDVVVRG